MAHYQVFTDSREPLIFFTPYEAWEAAKNNIDAWKIEWESTEGFLVRIVKQSEGLKKFWEFSPLPY